MNGASNAVQETFCTTCIHKDVCSLKAEYMSIQNSINTIAIPDYFECSKLSCIHYSKHQILRGDI